MKSTFAGVFSLLVVAVSTADAATCSAADAESVRSLYQAAAKRYACSTYANTTATGAIMINWTCETTSCASIMQQLAEDLPNCELAATGVNNRAQLEDALYKKCKFCTSDQDKLISKMWSDTAHTAACSPYATDTATSTEFKWTCDAKSCVAKLKSLADKVPDCFTGTLNEKNRLLRSLKKCTDAPLSTLTPSPGMSSTGVGASSSSGDGWNVVATPSPKPTPVYYSTWPCMDSEEQKMAKTLSQTALGSDCKAYSNVTRNQLVIDAPCSSACVTQAAANLTKSLPDCTPPFEFANTRQKIANAIEKCAANNGSTNTSAMFHFSYQTVFYTLDTELANSTTPAPAATSASASIGHASPLLALAALAVAALNRF